MQVTIKGVTVEYEPRYSTSSKAWTVQRGDAFQLVELGGTPCFVKRFESRPRAGSFLLANKDKQQPGIPIIYDAKTVREDGREVRYLFLERFDGVTLDKLLGRPDGKVSVALLGTPLLAALRVFHAADYWHADFCAGNVMVSPSGRKFVFIDLDSLEPLAARPTNGSNEPGSVINQELATYALRYVQEYVQPSAKSFADFTGQQLNRMQLVMLLDQIAYFQVVMKPEGKKFGDKKAFKDFPQLIHQYLPDYTTQVFKRILAGSASDDEIRTQAKIFQEKLVVPPAQAPASPIPAAPQPSADNKKGVQYFRASKHVVAVGESFELSWSVKGVTEVIISGLGKQPPEGSRMIRNEGTFGNQIYGLYYSGLTKVSSLTVTFVTVPAPSATVPTQQKPVTTHRPTSPPKPPTPPTLPTLSPATQATRIIHFWTTRSSLLPGETFTLSWEVEGAAGAHISGIGSVEPKGTRTLPHPGTEWTQEYTLSAGLSASRKSVQINFRMPVIIPVTLTTSPPSTPKPPLPPPPKPTPLWPIFAGICVLASFLMWATSQSAPAFTPNVLRGIALYDAAQADSSKYDSCYTHLSYFESDTTEPRRAQYLLSQLYDDGLGTRKDKIRAVRLLRIARYSTDSTVAALSWYWLGRHYQAGDGCPSSVPDAKWCFKRVSDYGDTVLLRQIGDMYRQGLGEGPNLIEAAEWYKKARGKTIPLSVGDISALYPKVTRQTRSYVSIKKIAQEQEATRIDFIILVGTSDSTSGRDIAVASPGAPDA